MQLYAIVDNPFCPEHVPPYQVSIASCNDMYSKFATNPNEAKKLRG